MDMTVDIFAQQPFGRIALKKLAPVPDNFRLYAAGWLGAKPSEWNVMQVTGAEFRVASTGKNKGKMTIMVNGTRRTAYVTAEEMNAEDA